MALIATASKQTRSNVIKILGMEDPHIISIPPHKANILYWVAEKRELQGFQPLIDKLLIQHTDIECVIIFVEGMKSMLIFMNCSNIIWVVASLSPLVHQICQCTA